MELAETRGNERWMEGCERVEDEGICLWMKVQGWREE